MVMNGCIEFREIERKLDPIMDLGYNGTSSAVAMAYYSGTVAQFRTYNNGKWSEWSDVSGSGSVK